MHVAAEIGVWSDAITLKLAKRLRASPQLRRLPEPLVVNVAGAVTLRLREFFLLHNNGRGTVAGYDAEDVATSVGWPGEASTLIRALQEARVLGRRKKTWVYVGWTNTPTGLWRKRADEDADRKRRERRSGGQDASDPETVSGGRPSDIRGTSGGRPSDVLQTSVQKEERNPDGAPPLRSPQGGEDSAAAEWDAFWSRYPAKRRRNRPATRRWFDELTPEQRAELGTAFPGCLDLWRKRKWKRVPFSDDFVRDERWHEFRGDRTEIERPPTEAPAAPKVDPEAERLEDRRRRRFALLRDIRTELRSRGIRGDELERKAGERLEREWPEGEDEPRPAGPFLVTVADGVVVQ